MKTKFEYTIDIISAVVFFCVFGGTVAAVHYETTVPPKETPKPGLVISGKIVDVYDGDTLTVEYTFRTKIRLLNCWAPEIKTKDESEKIKGIKSAEHLREFADGSSCIVYIPTGEADDLSDVLTFGRVLGFVYVDGKNLSEYQTESGFATKAKE